MLKYLINNKACIKKKKSKKKSRRLILNFSQNFLAMLQLQFVAHYDGYKQRQRKLVSYSMSLFESSYIFIHMIMGHVSDILCQVSMPFPP